MKMLTAQEMEAAHQRSQTMYPVPFTCRCEEFNRDPQITYRYTVYARMGGQGSPNHIPGAEVTGRCDHEASYNVDLKQFPYCPREVSCNRITEKL